jgi:hypothetical protein
MNVKPLLFVLCAVIFYATACKKNNDAPTPAGLTDSLNIVNASADTVNIYLNGTRLNGNSSLYPGGSTAYSYYVPVGKPTFQVKKTFNPATSAVQTLFSYTPDLAAHHYYSWFIAGESASQSFTTVDELQNDTEAGTCYVRFVNASPSGGTLSFSAGGVAYNNQAFGSASTFQLVDTASLSPILLYQAGSSTPAVSGHYPLLEGYSYTFYAQGTPNGTGNSVFTVGVTVNIE